MTPFKQKLTIQQGRTFRLPIRWESEVWAYAVISAILAAGPCRVTTQSAHNLPDGWRAAVVSALGMVEANAVESPPVDTDLRRVTVVSPTAVEFNELNSSGFTPYTSGGYLQYRVPMSLTGHTARMSVKDKVGGTVLLLLTTENTRIVINQTTKVIELVISAADTAVLTWKAGVYDLELVSPSLEITAICTGSVVVVPEVTT